ncbi:MAG: heme exporter protein CcmD [Solirubrobacteraceae bacterium]
MRRSGDFPRAGSGPTCLGVAGLPVLAVRPALSLHAALPYVAASYLVFVAVILIYVTIMTRKQRRLQRQVAELAALARRQLNASSIAEPVAGEHDQVLTGETAVSPSSSPAQDATAGELGEIGARAAVRSSGGEIP